MPSSPARGRLPKQSAEEAQAAIARATRVSRISIAIAAVMVLLAFVLLILVMVFITIADRSATSASPAPLYLVGDGGSDDNASRWLISAPGVLVLLATVVAFISELYRRGTWRQHDRGFLQGGTNTVDLVALRTRTHIVLLLVAVVGWVAIVLAPVILEASGGWPGYLHPAAHHAAWSLLVGYGGLSAALAAASGASLLKKATYSARADAHQGSIRAGSFGVRFWRWFSFRWRFELWIAGIGGGIVACAPVAFLFWPTSGAFLTLAIGVVLCVIAIVLCLNAWRSGESLYRGESVS
jgi:hypothetical protein